MVGQRDSREPAVSPPRPTLMDGMCSGVGSPWGVFGGILCDLVGHQHLALSPGLGAGGGSETGTGGSPHPRSERCGLGVTSPWASVSTCEMEGDQMALSLSPHTSIPA